MSNRHVYGPVPSRRLGLSLGVDAVPFKSCPFDCIYCQLGSTGAPTTERRRFGSPALIVAEIMDKLASGPRPDFITLGGSGEPTLALELGELIGQIKAATDIPVALLSGGALFALPAVRAAARLADLILPSLDAGDDELFALVNRPAPGMTWRQVSEGLVALRQEYAGAIWLEVMMLAGISDRADRLDGLVRAVERVAPDRVQLNTPVRPAKDPRVAAMTPGALDALCGRFTPRAEVIADFPLTQQRHARAAGGPHADDVTTVLARRPCTTAELALVLGVSESDIDRLVQPLVAAGALEMAPGSRFLRLPGDAAVAGPPASANLPSGASSPPGGKAASSS